MATSTGRRLLTLVCGVLLAVALSATDPAHARADTPDGHLWTVDTSDPITTGSIASVRSQAGDTPDVWGRYINFCTSGVCTNMSKAEIAAAQGAGISLFFLSADTVVKSGSTAGGSNATATVKAAQALSLPKEALLVDDIEAGVSTDAPYLEAWYKGVSGAGYRAGFYTGADNFSSAFCTAVAAVPAMKTAVAIDTPDVGSYGLGGAKAPKFTSTDDWPSCGGTHAIWQYTLSNGTSNPPFDQDETDPNLAGLLLPNGTVTGGGAGSGGYTTNGGWFEHTDSTWHGVVLGKDYHTYELIGGPTQQWQTGDLGGLSRGTLSITHTGGRYDYWALSPSGYVWQRTYDNGALAPWHAAGITTKFDPDDGIVALYAGGTFKIFGVGSNGNAYYSVENNGTWTTTNLLGDVTGTLGVVYVSGRYDLWGLSPTGQVEQITSENGTWGAWHPNAITTVYAANSGLSALYAQGEYRVFGIGSDGAVYQNYYSPTYQRWYAQDLGGRVSGTPAVTFNNGRYDLFTLAAGSGNVYQQTYTSGSGNGWTTPKLIALAP